MSRAARYDRFGPASVVSVVQVDEPHPGAGQVRVKVKAAGLNPVDSKMRAGGSRHAVRLPSGIGRELAGVVDEVGDGVTGLVPGTNVFGTLDTGALAEYAVVDVAGLASKPAALDWVVAGALALAGQTAYDAFASQHVTDADTVLVSAAAGGVGSILAQLAVRAGATVLGTASEGNHDFLRSLGVIPVDYAEGLVDRIRSAAPSPVTVVFDQHGADTILAAIALGVDRARINTIATDPALYGVRRVGRGSQNTGTLDTLAGMVVAGNLKISIDRVFPLDDIVAAFEHLERGHLRGKVVVVP